MKKYIYSLVLIAAVSTFSNAQVEENEDIIQRAPKHRLQLGSTFSDLFVANATIDINYRYSSISAIGIELSRFSTITLEDSPLNPYLLGNGIRVYQKIYLRNNNDGSFTYFRHGFRTDKSSTRYDLEDWYAFEEDGNSFLVFEERRFVEDSYRLGYDFILGLEGNHESWILVDTYIGLTYLKQYQAERFTSNNIVSPLFSGFKPVIGMRMAIYLDRDYGSLFRFGSRAED